MYKMAHETFMAVDAVKLGQTISSTADSLGSEEILQEGCSACEEEPVTFRW